MEKKFPLFLKSTLNSKGEAAIYLAASIHGKRFKYGIGKSIKPEHWNKEDGYPYNPSKIKEQKEKNTHKLIINRIDDVRKTINSYIQSKELISDTIDLEELKDILNKKFKTAKKKDAQNGINSSKIVDYMDAFVKNATKGNITILKGNNSGQRYKAQSIKSMKSTISVLKEFEKDKLKFSLLFESISTDIYLRFVRFCNEKGYSRNYTGKHIKHLKTIMEYAFIENVHTNTIHKHPIFKTLSAPSTEVYLDESELRLINEYDLSNNKPLEKIRDSFLICCYTALRIADTLRIQPHNIKDGYLHIFPEKVEGKVVIPIRPELEIILKRYDYKAPKVYDQKVNKGIKEICKELGIDELIPVVKHKAGRKIEVKVPKYQMIKTHTGRRTGATLLYLENVPTFDIMKLTGHTTEKNFLKYIRVTPEQVAKRLKKSKFFSGSTLKKVQ